MVAKKSPTAKAPRSARGAKALAEKSTSEKQRLDRQRKTKDAKRENIKSKREAQPKAPSLTMSQRRAMLKLLDGPVSVTTVFNAMPLDRLVDIGYATVVAGDVTEQRPARHGREGMDDVTRPGWTYTLTDVGRDAAKEINPKWRDFRSGQQSPPASEG